MRLHICWGNYEGPHSFDCRCSRSSTSRSRRAAGDQHRGANPRHDHEWQDLKTIKIPDDKVLIRRDRFHHKLHRAPEAGGAADRRYADWSARARDRRRRLRLRHRGAHRPIVVDSIVWAKLKALSEGAEIASKRLWS